VVLVVAAAILGVWRSHGGIRRNLSETIGGGDVQGEAREEIRKSYQLQSGAHVEVSGINGAVDIQASDGNTAEVYVLRTGTSQEALNRREVVIEQTPTSLVVRGQKSKKLSLWDCLWGRSPNEQVTIKAPRQIGLAVKGVNGHVFAGDTEGPIEVKGINGRVDLGQATNYAELSGINGNIGVGLKQLDDQGVRINGVNGNIELRLASDLNANLTARGINGSLHSEIPEVRVEREEHWGRYSAQIGKGGAPITFHGINGNVRLTRGSGLPPLSSDKTSSDANASRDAKAASDSKAAKDVKGTN
jgi:hypothetical protein